MVGDCKELIGHNLNTFKFARPDPGRTGVDPVPPKLLVTVDTVGHSRFSPLTTMSLGVLKTAAHNAGRRAALRPQVGLQGNSCLYLQLSNAYLMQLSSLSLFTHFETCLTGNIFV